MGGNRQRKQGNSALQARIAALTQPMPGHETALVDFEKRSLLSPVSAKVLLGIVAAVVLLVGGVGLLSRGGQEDQDVISPAGKNVDESELAEVLPGGTGDGDAEGKGSGEGEGNGEPSESEGEAPEAGASGVVIVSVQGKVRTPGLLELRAAQRLGDAINQAGGALPGANLKNVNLAEKATDGLQVVVDQHGSYVLRPGEAGPGGAGAGGGVAGAGSAGAGSGGAGASGAQAAPGGGKVSINSADASQLETLDGVGPATAKAIIDWREANGPFRSVEQLMEVRGIGPGKLAAMKDGVTL